MVNRRKGRCVIASRSMARRPASMAPCPRRFGWFGSFVAAAIGTACESAQPPDFLGQQAPTPAADVLCNDPGFVQDIGPDRYRLVDMDQGKSCPVFVEQDDCVVAIFRDCTDDSTTPREWQGRARTDGSLRLDPLTPPTALGTALLRQPRCCEGPIVASSIDVEGATEWALLDCRDDVCESANRRHTGLYLTRNTTITAALSVLRTAQIAAAGPASRSVSGVWDSVRRQSWWGWGASGGLYVSDEMGDAALVDASLSVDALAQSSDRVFAIGGQRLSSFDKQIRTATVLERPGSLSAVTALQEDVLVAVELDDSSVLELRDGETLSLLFERPLSGTVTGLAPRPGGGTIVTVDDPARLVVLTASLAVSQTIEMGKFTDLGVEDVVPFAPRFVDRDRVAFAGACYRLSSKVHCYFEHDLSNDSTRTERIGVPEESRLMDVLVSEPSPTADPGFERNVWLAGFDGAVHRIERRLGAPFVRPRPESVTHVDHDVSALVAADGVIFALSGTGQITVLQPAP